MGHGKQMQDDANKGIFVDQWRDSTWSGGYTQQVPAEGHSRLSEKVVEYVLGGSSPTALGLKKSLAKDVKKHAQAGHMSNGVMADEYAPQIVGGEEVLDKKNNVIVQTFDMGGQPSMGFDYPGHAGPNGANGLISSLDASGSMLPDYPGNPTLSASQQTMAYPPGSNQQRQQPPQGQ